MISQNTYDIIEVVALSIGCVISFVTWIYVTRYTRSTNSIARSTHETAMEAAETAKITQEAVETSSKALEEMRETRDAQTAPYVFVYFDQVEGEYSTKIFLVVKNAGGGQDDYPAEHERHRHVALRARSCFLLSLFLARAEAAD